MNTATTTILTPSQFVAARALAKAFSHLWSDVPDGTYDIDAIRTLAQEWQHRMLPAGIEAPDVIEEDGFPVVDHVTGTGRLRWQVYQSGNVCLEVYRPSDICVARFVLVNDDDQRYTIDDDYEISISDSLKASQHLRYDPDLKDDLLFERHVHALVRPIVALLTTNVPERAEDEDDDEWKAKHIRPAIETAKQWLAPLFERALPDPFIRPSRWNHETNQYEYGETPQTYWARSDDTDCVHVVHSGEQFPVESEKTAVHAVLLLQQRPGMSLIDAVKAAIQSPSYRP